MSRFSTMTTGERKMQAAAICREVQAQEDLEMDLGKKVSVPQDIMLEELSLASNRGSCLFKMRQRRSEKYTFEGSQDENEKQPHNTVAPQGETGKTMGSCGGESNSGADRLLKVPLDTPNTRTAPNPDSIAPGYGAPLRDSTAVPKSYRSPWEQALNKDLADTVIAGIPGPEPQQNPAGYKSFNRVAIPFGGFSEAPKPAPMKTPQAEPLPDYPELRGQAALNRPSFNRSALGWASTGGPVPVPAAPLERTLIPESDDL